MIPSELLLQTSKDEPRRCPICRHPFDAGPVGKCRSCAPRRNRGVGADRLLARHRAHVCAPCKNVLYCTTRAVPLNPTRQAHVDRSPELRAFLRLREDVSRHVERDMPTRERQRLREELAFVEAGRRRFYRTGLPPEPLRPTFFRPRPGNAVPAPPEIRDLLELARRLEASRFTPSHAERGDAERPPGQEASKG